jgi:hypothetical protein
VLILLTELTQYRCGVVEIYFRGYAHEDNLPNVEKLRMYHTRSVGKIKLPFISVQLLHTVPVLYRTVLNNLIIILLK